MSSKDLPPEFIRLCKRVTAKRPKTVIRHILRHGHITTEELKERYGYNHPPRAARDVKEQGIPIEMFRVVGRDGRKIAAYKFGDPSKARFKILKGRTNFSKKLKQKLIAKYGSRCAIYLEPFDERDLQIDHRVPYEIAGDVQSAKQKMNDFVLLCGSANRAKSWSCEHCVNWVELKKREICKNCYWAYPENYTHIAMRPLRRIDLIWSGEEVSIYEKLKQKTIQLQKEIPNYVKEIIEKQIKEE